MKRLLLISLILMWAMPSWATYYVVGNSPIGNGFSPDKGRVMTEHPDGTYTLKCDAFSGYIRFVFADSLAKAGDWDSFCESMRIGPVEGLENIESGTWIPTQKVCGDANSAYRFYGRGGNKYLITLDVINWRFRIDIDNSENCDFIKDGICYKILNDHEVSVTYYRKGYGNLGYYQGHITIPETVTNYEDSYTVTAIGDSSFYFAHLTEIDLPKTITSIGVDAFCCSGIQKIELPNSVTFIGEYAFFDNYALTEIKLPSSLDAILEGTFSGTGLIDVDIPNSVRFIGEEAFYGCVNLKSINIPESVNSILDYTFTYCQSLREVSLPYNLTNIGYCAFAECNSLRDIEFPASLTQVDIGAFYMCDSLETVRTPSLEAWCNIVFEDFDSYVSNPLYYAKHFIVGGEEMSSQLVIPEGVTAINMCSFIGFEGMTSVIIPNTVKTIGQSAFAVCPNLQEVTFGDGVEFIDNYAFEGCQALQAINLPRELRSIGHFAFYNCKGLTELVLPNSLLTIGNYTFANCQALENVSFGNSLENIGQYAFTNDYSLTEVKLSNSVKSIQTHAFSYCKNLKTVSLGKSMESIGTNAFYEDNELMEMYCKAQTPPSLPSITPHLQHNTNLYVPIKSLELYKSTLPWKCFEHIIGQIDADVNGDDEINIADVNTVIDSILSGDNYSDLQDVNGDGEINIADINAIIDAILGE